MVDKHTNKLQYYINVLSNINFYKFIMSVLLGLISYTGIFYAICLEYGAVRINIVWSLAIPLLIALAWGRLYGCISIFLGGIVLYPFLLGEYNGWASLVPAFSLFVWIMLHGYGAELRILNNKFYLNIYFIQLIYVLIRLLLYYTVFPLMFVFNPPPWNPEALTAINIGTISIFALKSIIIETMLLAVSDVLLLLPSVRRLFRLKYSNTSRYNTKIILSTNSIGIVFMLVIMTLNHYIMRNEDPSNWIFNFDKRVYIALLMMMIACTIFGGLIIRTLERRLKAEEQLIITLNQLNELNSKLETLVIERTSELQSAVNELEAYTYTVSHDLKSPLRAIEGYSDFIKEDYGHELDPEVNQMINNIKTICSDMINLINKLLNYSITSKVDIVMEPVNIRALSLSIFHDFVISNAHRKLEFIFDNELPFVKADRILLKEAITNIISNAVKFTRDCEVTHITMGCKTSDTEHTFYIKDNGVGFDMQFVNKLYGVFQRLHTSKDYEGSGIGLATIRKIIQRHGGKTWIESELGIGTTIYFSLPF